MNSEDHIFLHAFLLIPGIGTKKLFLLENHFDSFEQAWHAKEEELLSAGLSQKIVDTICKKREKIVPTQEWDTLQKESIFIVPHSHKNYPSLLREIDDHPFALYMRGNVEALHKPLVAIVGSRKYSTYGKHATTSFAQDLARSGTAIVSGLALGIDSLAHSSACETKMPASTIAVLGGGIDDATIAPRSHVGLAHTILAQGGLLISEYVPGTKPGRGTFPARNRIMAAISHATLVIEAGAQSGTLITAQLAHHYHKKLFAIPGSIFVHESVGTNTLIADGAAQLARSAQDIITALNITQPETQDDKKDYNMCTPEEQAIIKALTQNPHGLSIDKIIRHTTLEGPIVSQTLVMMEIEGYILDLGGGRYVIL